eukprot:TRINITY_DN8341_c0_g1_i5.p1 TRINITY_DN8341_c0_g1~~TRINITY_DN8341_c0_g1_i5.p1  ORF type:complete len:211 (-),score=90.80 TRINITY_DN8341_c0_g1_i5:294-902(-)
MCIRDRYMGGGRKHFPMKYSDVAISRPGIRIVGRKTESKDKEMGVKKIDVKYEPTKPRAERQHFGEKLSGSMNPFKGGLKPFPERHAVTTNEHFLEIDMGQKGRVPGMRERRNKLPYTSLGDKPYKYVEDAPEYYKGGGLIPGSTQPEKMEKKGVGNTKIIDYYATLDLTKKVMNKDLLWTEKVKKEELAEDMKAVDELISW